jgi:glycosyltransferase involved in cell wall biosynthesis
LDLSGLNLLDCIRTKNPFNRCLKPTLKPKDIDVCITTYNRKCDLEQTLNEFAKQKGTNFNVLVNDDGSKELLDPYMFSVLDQYMWTKDIGFTKVARVNESVQMCPSELILMLDDDAIPIDNDFLRKHVFYLQEADVTFGRVVHSNFSEPFVRCPANLGFRKEKLLKNYGIYYPEYNGHYGFEDTDLFNEIRYLRLKTIKINAVVKMNSPNYSAETRSFDITRNGKILTKRWNGWRNIYWRAYEKWIRIWETISPVKTNTAINE